MAALDYLAIWLPSEAWRIQCPRDLGHCTVYRVISPERSYYTNLTAGITLVLIELRHTPGRFTLTAVLRTCRFVCRGRNAELRLDDDLTPRSDMTLSEETLHSPAYPVNPWYMNGTLRPISEMIRVLIMVNVLYISIWFLYVFILWKNHTTARHWSALPSGGRGRRFESSHSDQWKPPWNQTVLRGFFNGIAMAVRNAKRPPVNISSPP